MASSEVELDRRLDEIEEVAGGIDGYLVEQVGQMALPVRLDMHDLIDCASATSYQHDVEPVLAVKTQRVHRALRRATWPW